MASYRVDRSRFFSAGAVGLLMIAFAITGCRKEQVQTTTVDSMSQTSHSPSASTAPMWSGDSSVATSATQQPASGSRSSSSPSTPSSSAPASQPGSPGSSGTYATDEHGNIDTSFKVTTIDTSSAMGQQMLKAMRQQQALKHYTAPRVEGYKLISPQRLAELQPKIPGYQMVRTPAALQVQGLSRSLALLRNTADTSKTIRVTIIDRDANGPINYLEEVNALRQTGSKTEYSEGEPVTAYYVQVGGMPGAKAYLASKKVATLTVVVNPHRLIQLREDKVGSADHLMEVSKYLDVKKFAEME